MKLTLKIFGLLFFGTSLFISLMTYSFNPDYYDIKYAHIEYHNVILVIVDMMWMFCFSAILASFFKEGA